MKHRYEVVFVGCLNVPATCYSVSKGRIDTREGAKISWNTNATERANIE